MRILITGAAGFLGSALAGRIAAALNSGAELTVNGESRPVHELILADIASIPESSAEGYSPLHGAKGGSPIKPTKPVRRVVCDFTDEHAVRNLMSGGYDLVFHLAAVVSGQAEQDFETGYKGNVAAAVHILESLKRQRRDGGPRACFFMTSSVAVFGKALPRVIPDTFPCLPLTSYGTQKAICELYTLDYSRRGFCDGRIIRLPTVAVRPGKPNAAASSFVSSIIREPLQGKEAICPVPEESELWITSPRAALDSMLHMVSLPVGKIADHRVINPVGLTVSVARMLDALRKIGGAAALELVKHRRDARIEDIVLSWPARFESRIAGELAFPGAMNMDDIVKEYNTEVSHGH